MDSRVRGVEAPTIRKVHTHTLPHETLAGGTTFMERYGHVVISRKKASRLFSTFYLSPFSRWRILNHIWFLTVIPLIVISVMIFIQINILVIEFRLELSSLNHTAIKIQHGPIASPSSSLSLVDGSSILGKRWRWSWWFSSSSPLERRNGSSDFFADGA